MIYIVSYVIPDRQHSGTIQSEEKRPEVGEIVRLGDVTCKVLEVQELVPPRGDFCYLHVSCKIVEEQ
ncbi:MAG: hypothetical protein ACUVV0_15500 [Anaerolineae bacterium]